MIKLSNQTKKELLLEAESMEDEYIKKFTDKYLSRYRKINPKRGVRFNHFDIQNVCDFVKEIDGLFILSKKEEQALSALIDEPIIIEFEEDVYREVPNRSCLINKPIPKIENFLNSLILKENGLTRYRKAISFIYNYMVKNGMVENPVSVDDIKNNFFNIKKNEKNYIDPDDLPF